MVNATAFTPNPSPKGVRRVERKVKMTSLCVLKLSYTSDSAFCSKQCFDILPFSCLYLNQF